MKTIVGYVSDEMYVALADVLVEFEPVHGGDATVLRSSPRGALYGDLAPGQYRVVLAKAGYGSKQFWWISGQSLRLLSDNLIGYMWPKWVRCGEAAEYRVHSTEQYQLSLSRYGLRRELIGVVTWVDEHGQQANRQILPDGDFTQTGTRWTTRVTRPRARSPHPNAAVFIIFGRERLRALVDNAVSTITKNVIRRFLSGRSAQSSS